METMTERLMSLMKIKGIKGIELAKATAVNTSTVSRILNGTQIPTADTLYKFAKFFNVTIEFLLTGEDFNPNNCADAKQLNKQELELLNQFRELPLEDQDELLAILNIKFQKAQRKRKEEIKSYTLTDPIQHDNVG